MKNRQNTEFKTREDKSEEEVEKKSKKEDGAAVQVEDVDLALGGVEILREVSTKINEGVFVGLIGPNGAGKTTLIRTMNAALQPDEGDVKIGGDKIENMSSKEASRRISTVPQKTNLSFSFDVGEIVSMGRNPHISRFGTSSNEDIEAVEEAMEKTEIKKFSNRSINEVSGGERQRVLLARALAQETPIVLLDEPTANLDINHQIQTLELVRDLVDEKNKTVVAAIHDLNLAAHYCDELVLVSDGKILSSGSPENVLTEENLEESFGTRAVVSRHPVTGSVYVTAMPQEVEKNTDSKNKRIHVIAGSGNASRLLYILSAAGYSLSVGALNEGDSDLETARNLGAETVVEEPFSSIKPEKKHEVENMVQEADITVIADIEIGDGNLPNLEAALNSDKTVLIEERDFKDRNYAGTRAKKTYRKLRKKSAVIKEDEVLDAIETS